MVRLAFVFIFFIPFYRSEFLNHQILGIVAILCYPSSMQFYVILPYKFYVYLVAFAVLPL
ncbi:hypothetical protein IEQ34_014603 [Dendrobium chrysotoxum]|uniref:Uncharacterized protein n=1 Tax=Dendrobium chrysotoxum TaxID=161865 RepID=A0AAV7GKQ7_DENCH|nr:hypothetical protein IEQ34_014603 [Dendrobium chrysotoxum]